MGNNFYCGHYFSGSDNFLRPTSLLKMRIRTNVSLAPLMTFGIGGSAAFFVKVSNADDLIEAVKIAKTKNLPYFLLAGGSNVVCGDGVWPGLVIYYTPRLVIRNSRFDLKIQDPRSNLKIQANLSLAVLIKTAISHGLADLETLSGIPGTVGGAIVGNAGAYGQCISDHLARVEIFDANKNVRRWLTKQQCRFAYRESIFKQKRDWLVLQAEFKLERGERKGLITKAREIIKIRNAKYAPGLRSPGSFFKNVLAKGMSRVTLDKIDQTKIRDGKIPAGYLLEAAGAKGLAVGGARVADFHGNLIINDGTATFQNVITLATKLKKLVQAKFDITLEEEVQYLI